MIQLEMLEEIFHGVEGERSKLGFDYNAVVETLDRANATLPRGESGSIHNPAIRRAQTELIEAATKLEKALTRRSEREKELTTLDGLIERATAKQTALGVELEEIDSARRIGELEKAIAEEEALANQKHQQPQAKVDSDEVELKKRQSELDETKRRAAKLNKLQAEAPNLRKKITQTRQERDKVEKNGERIEQEIVKLEDDLKEKAKVLKELRDEAQAKTCDTNQ